MPPVLSLLPVNKLEMSSRFAHHTRVTWVESWMHDKGGPYGFHQHQSFSLRHRGLFRPAAHWHKDRRISGKAPEAGLTLFPGRKIGGAVRPGLSASRSFRRSQSPPEIGELWPLSVGGGLEPNGADSPELRCWVERIPCQAGGQSFRL